MQKAQNMKQYKLSFLIPWIVTLYISGFLFGYTLFCYPSLSDTMIFLYKWESTFYTSAATASIMVGAVIGAFPAGWFIMRGRLRTIIIGNAIYCAAISLFVVSWLLLQVGHSFVSAWIFLGGRILTGFACGLYTSVLPPFMGEIAPLVYVGRILSIYQLVIAAGISAAFGVGAWLGPQRRIWAPIINFAVVPCFLGGIQTILLSFVFPHESPCYLVGQRKPEEAKAIIDRYIIQTEVKEKRLEAFSLERDLLKKGKTKTREVAESQIAKMVLILTILAIFLQACGLNAVGMYLPTLLSKVSEEYKYILSFISSLTTNIAGVFALLLSNSKRRPMLFWGACSCGICLFGIALFAYEGIGSLLYISAASFRFCYCLTLGPFTWTYLGESMPAQYMGWAMFGNWLTNIMVTAVSCLLRFADSNPVIGDPVLAEGFQREYVSRVLFKYY